MLNRAYSVLTVKSIDAERRVISGVASTPEADRMGDIIESKGVSFSNPLPLLLYHDSHKPVGRVTFAQPTAKGIDFEAHIPEITEPGTLKDRVDEAWQSVKARLISAVSIGFRPLNDAIEIIKETGGFRFLETEVLELSLVVIPANASALIHTIKSLDHGLAVSGKESEKETVKPAAVVASVAYTARKGASTMTYQERIAALEGTRGAKSAELETLQKTVNDAGVTKDEAQRETFNELVQAVKEIDAELADLRVLETLNKAAAKPVSGETQEKASASRTGSSVVSVRSQQLPPGIGMARFVMCSIVAHKNHMNVMDIAKARYPDHGELHQFIMKAAVPAAATTNPVWAGTLSEPTISTDFVEWLRPQTIVGKFGTNGIPSLRATPFNVKVKKQTSGATAYWVGEGKPKPLTSFGLGSDTLLFTKIATIAVITQEQARFSTPSAEALVRDELRNAVVERMDIDFIDPAQAAVTGTNPASITNGLVALTSAGPDADDVRADLLSLLSQFIEGNRTDPTGLVLIMPTTLALALSLMTNALGQTEFPNISMRGGTLSGIPVIPSQYAANASGSGNLVIAVNAPEIYLADDGQVSIDASGEASLEMLDNPTNDSVTPTATSMVSMFQTDSVAIKAERFINWMKRRSDAVVYMDDVNWGSVGSPS